MQLVSDPPGHGETGLSQCQELHSSHWPGLHRYVLAKRPILNASLNVSDAFFMKVHGNILGHFNNNLLIIWNPQINASQLFASEYQICICVCVTELPVTSPLSNAVLKTLETWEQLLLERMNTFDGPPPNYINTYPTDLSTGGGPAILRHKAMLEPDNTPFK